jgi:glycosyltransferase involved in cell wall biosynthesis
MTVAPTRPLVSIVVEGYNESRELGKAVNTLDALAEQQGCPLDQVEIVLVGSPEQIEAWSTAPASRHPFFGVKTVPIEDAHYLELKNAGADAASGQIIAFTDSDVLPRRRWLASIIAGIESGADVTVGLTLFKSAASWDPTPASRQAAASVTWGWVVGRNGRRSRREPVGFMDHNYAVRTEVARDHPYRTDHGRLLGGPLKYRELANARRTIELQPEQQVVHYHSWPYWLVKLHFRYGYEVYMLRRLDRDYPNQWIRRTGVLEPVVTMGWHMLLDLPRWVRFSGLLGLRRSRRLLLLPLVVAMSAAARSAEMAGMYCTMAAPNRMRRWAQQV